MTGPYRALLEGHKQLVLACFLGWFLDAFDQVALLLVIPDVAREFHVSLTAMGVVLTAQSVGRMVGNTAWGWLADRYGRKPTFLIGVVWFAAFSGLSGLAPGYGALLAIQFLFGMGFGGEWTASAALLMESVPERSRAAASSLMMAGFEFGFFAASAAQAVVLPTLGWRWMFFLGVLPAALAILIRIGIAESPVWLAERERRARGGGDAGTERPRVRRLWNLATLQACGFMLFVQFGTASIYSFYPTLLRDVHHWRPEGVFPAIAAFAVGSVAGKLACGWLATRFGRRRVILVYLAAMAVAVFPFVAASSLPLVVASALGAGFAANGLFAIVPDFLSVRFASGVRSLGMGFAYAVASAGAAVSGTAVPALGRAVGLGRAIEILGVASAVGAAFTVVRAPRRLPGEDDLDEGGAGR